MHSHGVKPQKIIELLLEELPDLKLIPKDISNMTANIHRRELNGLTLARSRAPEPAVPSPLGDYEGQEYQSEVDEG